MALVGGSTGVAIGRGFLLDRRRLGPARWVPARSRAGARQGTTYPSGGGALTVPRGAAPRGPSVIGSWSRWDRRRLAPATWFPARDLSLIHISEPTRRGAAGRSLGYFRAQVRALIWIRILREQGLGKKVFCGGGIPPTKASPRGEGFGVGKPSFRVSDTCRPTDSPGRAHPAGPGGSPQKDPKGPTNLSAPPTRPVGHTQQVRAAARKKTRRA